MSASTAGLKCPVCGEWVSTDAPRFGPRGGSARDVVYQVLSEHLQTYHPDYLSWDRPYQLSGRVLFLAGFVLALYATYLMNPLFLLLAVLGPVTPGVPLLILYRRKFSEFKRHWTEEHPLGWTHLTSEAVPSVNRCRICGEVIPIKKGVGWDLRDHYQSNHPAYYQWELRRAPLVVVALFLAGVAALVLGLSLDNTLPAIFGVVGFLVFMAVAMLYGFMGQRRFRTLSGAKVQSVE
jgi:peptidoglycan/LPS O-acetylase OafA/YrhL